MRALIVDERRPDRIALVKFLTDKGHSVAAAASGEAALRFSESEAFDLILTELRLSDVPGIELIGEIRRQAATPIIVVSVYQGLKEKVAAFDAGADNYLVKPFDEELLGAMIRAVVRRNSYALQTVTVGEVRIDLRASKVWVGEEEIHFTSKEYKFLAYLAREGRLCSSDELHTYLYGGHDQNIPISSVLPVLLHRVRRKLGNPLYIETSKGLGYMLIDPQEKQAAE